MKLRKRYLIPIVVLVLLAAGGLSLRWHFNTPAQRARRLVREILRADGWITYTAEAAPGLTERWLIKMGLAKPKRKRDPQEIMDEIVALGEAAVPALVEALPYDFSVALPSRRPIWQPQPAAFAIRGPLLRLGQPARRALLEATRHHDAEMRAAALGALGWMCEGGHPIAPKVRSRAVECLTDESAEVRANAARTLCELSVPNDRTPDELAALIRALKDEDEHVRTTTAWVLTPRGCRPGLSSGEICEHVQALLDGRTASQCQAASAQPAQIQPAGKK